MKYDASITLKLQATFGLIAFALMMAASNVAEADALTPDDPEYKQLEAMGYDVSASTTNKNLSVAQSGNVAIVIDKAEDRTAIWRSFSRRALNESETFELHKLVNELQIQTFYQITLDETSMSVILYNFGPNDAKTFAKIIRNIEKADIIFTAEPRILKLLND